MCENVERLMTSHMDMKFFGKFKLFQIAISREKEEERNKKKKKKKKGRRKKRNKKPSLYYGIRISCKRIWNTSMRNIY